MSSIHIIILGATGRMGSRIASLARDDRAFNVAARVAREARDGSVTIDDCFRRRVPDCDVVIDFTSESGVVSSIALARRYNAALLVGTTGLSPVALDSLKSAAHQVAVLHTPNTSLGIAALADAASTLAERLGPGYAAFIEESHHAKKKDAPSGTAQRLAAALREAGANIPSDHIHATRAGDIIGEHTIRLIGPGEVIELTHRATTRDLFAFGALRAASWLAGKKAGWYTMDDVIG